MSQKKSKGKNKIPGKHVGIIGAGIVGVSTAIWLQRAGHQVTLIDREGPAAGASFGNGGVLASAAVVPVTVPGLVSKAPKMLFDPSSPLFLKWGYLPKLLPWLVQYLKHTRPHETRRIAEALTPVLYDSLEQHQALAKGTGAEAFIKPSDYIYGYKDKGAFESDAYGWGLRKDMGFSWQEMSASEFDDYDPAFKGTIGYGIKLSDHGYISDPGAYVKALAQEVEKKGGKLIKAEINDLLISGDQIAGMIIDGETHTYDEVVIAAGVWSGPLAKKLGITVPLETERGYHIELVNPSVMPKAPVMIASGKFVATPMDGRIRCAGVVEFGGLDAEPSRKPFELLKSQIHAAMPGLKYDRIDEWMGHRPAPTDSIPLIGEFPAAKGAFAAFGHHHVGLTGGPKTGRLVASMIDGGKSNIDLAPYSMARFT